MDLGIKVLLSVFKCRLDSRVGLFKLVFDNVTRFLIEIQVAKSLLETVKRVFWVDISSCLMLGVFFLMVFMCCLFSSASPIFSLIEVLLRAYLISLVFNDFLALSFKIEIHNSWLW